MRCNNNHHKKWTRQFKSKFWTWLFVFKLEQMFWRGGWNPSLSASTAVWALLPYNYLPKYSPMGRLWCKVSFYIEYSWFTEPLALWVECSPMVQKTRIQFQVESYQRLKKWYLMPPCLTLSIIKYRSRVKWSNPGKE